MNGTSLLVVKHGLCEAVGAANRVAQICNLLYRRIAFCRASDEGRVHRDFAAPAECNAAIESSATLRSGRAVWLALLLGAISAHTEPATNNFLFIDNGQARLGVNTTQTASASPEPNILIIVSDDQGYGDLSLHGNPDLRTPHLDRLGTNSIQFDRFYVSPLCAPTRASLLTGRYSLRTGAQGVSRGEETMRAGEVTFAEVLRDAGWRTGLFGKWHNGEHFPYTPQGQGFDESFGFNLGHWNNYFDTHLKSNGTWVATSGYITDVLTDAALRFIEGAGEQPWLCYLAYNVPHSPFQVPDRYFERHKAAGLDDRLAAIYGMVENMDDNIGRLLSRLDELGLAENTLVLFLSDNGPNGARFNAGMRGTKGSLHEGGSRVPCFLRWPQRFQTPRVIPQIAAHLDVFPTLLDLCGVAHPGGLRLDGRSLVPLLDGTAATWPDRTIFGQHQAGPRAERTGSLRTQKFRMVNEGRGWELFDMETDPGQTRDVSASFPEEKTRLVSDYEQWWREIKAEMPASPPPIPVGYPQELVVELPVPQASFTGGLHFSGKHPNNAWLTDWTNVTAKVEWTLDVVRAGDHEVVLQYLCPTNSAGSKVRVSAANTQRTATVTGTPRVQVPSPDRFPRDEVYELQWQDLPVGRLHLSEGEMTLRVEALEIAGGSVMELKSVILRQVK